MLDRFVYVVFLAPLHWHYSSAWLCDFHSTACRPGFHAKSMWLLIAIRVTESCTLPAVVITDPQRQRLNKRSPSEEDIETSVALTARVIKQTVIDARYVAKLYACLSCCNMIALCLKACVLA